MILLSADYWPFLSNIIGSGYSTIKDNSYYFRMKHGSYIYDSKHDLKYYKFSLKYKYFIFYKGGNHFSNVNVDNLTFMCPNEGINEEDIEIIMV